MSHRYLVEGEIEECEPGSLLLRMVDLVAGVAVELFAGTEKGWISGVIGFDGESYSFVEPESGISLGLETGMPMRTTVTIH